MSWELEVYSPNGQLRRVLTPEDAVDSVRWALRGDDDCLEAAITGHDLDLRPRDAVAIKVPSDGTNWWEWDYVYWGWVTESVARSPHLATTRLIGGRKRLTEVLVRDTVLGGVDVPGGWDAAQLALAAAANAERLPLITVLPARFANTGFAVGARIPKLETLAETLDALEATVPGFTVAPGTSYTYRLRPYGPGERVPPVRWGVSASWSWFDAPSVFFQRDTTFTQVLSEVDDSLIVHFEPLSSEETVDDVTVLLFDNHNVDTWTKRTIVAGNPTHAPEPVSYRRAASGSSYAAERLVPINPLDGLKRATPVTLHQQSGWLNPHNAIDNDLDTYARNEPSSGVISLEFNLPPATVAVRVRYSAFEDLKASYSHAVAGGSPYYNLVANLGTTGGEQRDHVLLLPTQAHTATCVKRIHLHKDADGAGIDADAIRIYDVAPLELDTTVLSRIADAHMALPEATAATITVPGQIVRSASSWRFNLNDGTALTGTAELIEYAITRDKGFETQIHLNQALTARNASQRALLDARIRRAVLGAARLQP